ncbi:MAG TPA: diguanylate cyclase [Acholeplasmataceae bacterium]|nr:diguanylate cyclase [Acholeplasmataceae bacterium]
MTEERIIMNLVLDIYSLLILAVVFFSSLKQRFDKSISKKIYQRMLFVVFFMLIADALSNFDGKAHSYYLFFNRIGNFFVFFFGPVIPILWIFYIAYEFLFSTSKIKKLKKVLFIIFTINTLLLIITQFTGWFYYIDSENFYHRGPLFLFFHALNAGLVFFSVYLIFTRRRLYKNYVYSLLVYAAIPVAGFILQILFYGYSVGVNSLILSLFVAFIYTQMQDLDTDFLTGVGNRRKLDQCLRRRVQANKPFSAILLDFDNFKHINDNFGHEAGDLALKKAAQILQASANEFDTIARYGGDEFCIITAINNRESLKEYVKQIRSGFQEYNSREDTIQPLELSIGYLTYSPNDEETLAEFLNKLDQKMYKDKFQRKVR